jgi:hypothetical protein
VLTLELHEVVGTWRFLAVAAIARVAFHSVRSGRVFDGAVLWLLAPGPVHRVAQSYVAVLSPDFVSKSPVIER